ncbi:phage N-6-adenine-methyltransferase [Pelagibacteraceae bacterium]|nr:phage N-6-adenine-methyltransferase [Pelagibacteraceae bacterium]
MTAGRQTISKQKDWCTPPKIAKKIHIFFDNKLQLDPCSNKYSLIDAKTKFILPKNGLVQEWNYKSIFVNPPYGSYKENKSTIKHWFHKILNSHNDYGSEIIALVPVATNTSHWKEFVYGEATSLCFLYDTRLKFMIDGKEDTKGAPMSCCLIYWGNKIKKFENVFIDNGAVIDLRDLKKFKSIGGFKKTKLFCAED